MQWFLSPNASVLIFKQKDTVQLYGSLPSGDGELLAGPRFGLPFVENRGSVIDSARTLLRQQVVLASMAEQGSRRISDDLLAEPHIADRRISVRQVYALVEDRGVDPESVADRFDLDVADVYHALAYYHDHPREMNEVETDREASVETFRESISRPDSVDPDTA